MKYRKQKRELSEKQKKQLNETIKEKIKKHKCGTCAPNAPEAGTNTCDLANSCYNNDWDGCHSPLFGTAAPGDDQCIP